MITTISWFCTLIALWGTWLNANQIKRGFVYWIIADLLLFGVFVSTNQWPQAVLFAAYTYLAAWGYTQWDKKE